MISGHLWAPWLPSMDFRFNQPLERNAQQVKGCANSGWSYGKRKAMQKRRVWRQIPLKRKALIFPLENKGVSSPIFFLEHFLYKTISSFSFLWNVFKSFWKLVSSFVSNVWNVCSLGMSFSSTWELYLWNETLRG